MSMHLKGLFAAVAVVATTPMAIAGGLGAPAAPPVAVAPISTVHDWSGVYGGVHLTYLEPIGYSDFGFYDGEAWDENQSAGLFAGYNFQNGAFVYGGEALLTFYDGDNEVFAGEFLEHFIEVRGRAGYAFQDFLVYGAVGISAQTWTDGVTDITLNGYTAALGVDYAINDNWFVGAEVAFRDVNNDPIAGYLENEIIVREESFRLRVGYNF
jgi:outer membrane immunogenic protein